MAEKEPRLVRPVEEQSSEDVTENTGKNENAIYPTFISLKGNVKFFPEKPPIADAQKAEAGKSLPEVETTVSSHIEEMFRAKVRSTEDNQDGLLEVKKSKDESKEAKKEKGKKKKKKKIRRMKNRVLPLDDTKDNADDNGIAGSEVDAARNKKTKIKEKKKKKHEETKAAESDIDGITEEETTESDKSKLPCLFGFISTWIAKRKQKRREKKKKAIAARASKQLVEYDHKSTRGGKSFIIAVENRPVSLKKPVLPPIKSTPGPIRLEREQNAANRRAEKLAQKAEVVKEYEKKKAKCKERKAENDFMFRHKVDVNIREKQANAERNRDIRSRCRSVANAKTKPVDATNMPSAQSSYSSFWSITGPSVFSEEDYDLNAEDVDDFDIPIF